MKSTKKYSLAFTLIELLVVISIILILAGLTAANLPGVLARAQLTGTLNNARSLQIATQNMAMDSFTAGDGPGWPGDSEGISWEAFCSSLTDGNYLSQNDLKKMVSAPGVKVGNSFPPSPSALQVYPVRENSPSDSVFISTQNWSGFAELQPDAVPYGDKGFVIFRKGGDGNVFQANQATNTNSIGTLIGAGFAPQP